MPDVATIYRLTKKKPDLVWNEYVCRPLGAVVVALVQETRITPNQVTLASLVVAGLSVGILVGIPGWAGLVLAAVVFELSYVLDCADGMLARLRNLQSTQGHLFDFLIDELKAFAVLGACSVRLWAERGYDAGYLLVGIVGLVAVASGIALTTFVRRPEIVGPSAGMPAGSVTAPRSPFAVIVGAVERVAKFVIHYPSYFLFVALSGRLEFYLFPYVAVNALYAARALLQVALRFGRA
ncbi:MAG TPA: CDP-alcohol phosphatidyltransferase family protein [Polyangiaceae bacterium]